MQRLTGKIAVVTGASRGGGRGIALALGDEGATVYVTGRSVAGQPNPTGSPETIDETAGMVTARGGLGIPVRIDHTVDAEVEALFDRVKAEQGRLDFLVNNAWGGYESYESDTAFDRPFWEQPLWRWHKMLDAGVNAGMVASCFAARIMLPQRSGLIVNTVADVGTRNWDLDAFHYVMVFYDTAKTAIDRIAFGMAVDLRPHGIAALTLAPGFMRTEAVLRAFKTDEARWQGTPGLERTETPLYLGRAVAALASDPDVLRKTGRLLRAADLAKEYGFTDLDGRYVPPFTTDDYMGPEG
jgi:NAD(P)-dependent dehydrogenase (short-subunit alcohol dehydrogenase family)